MASACVPICYFGEFQKNENGQWEWRWTSEGDGVKAIFITKSTLFTEMYYDIQNMLNIDPSQYDMELGFLFQKHSTISIPPMKITSEVEMKHLIKLNQGRKSTPICVTLLRKNVPVGEQEIFDEEDRNVNDVCDTVQIAHKDDVVILETVVTHHGPTITCRIPSTIDDNKNENTFTNEDLIALSHGKHESGGSSKAGPSTRSFNCSRVVPNDEDVYIEQLFESKKDLQEAMHRIALKHNFEFKVKKSNKSTYTIICIDDSCHWRLRATKMDTNELFVIRKYAREHTCEVGILQNDHRQARAWFIGREIMQKFHDPRMIYKPSDIINDVRREYGVVMSYQKAWKAKECALEDLIGLVEESYAKLARYCYNMEKTNTGSAFYIEMDGENHFKYLFMALGQCVRGFRNAMRPLILIDVVTFKVRYEGKLIIATCQYANIQIYPLAFSMVDGENDLAMRWFFTKLREVIGDIENLAFVTDRGQSIINGIVEVFPEAHHGYCMYHIQENLKTRYRGSDIVGLFRRAAEAYSFEEFEKFMVEIKNKSHGAWDYLTEMGIEHWARSHFSGRRYNMMTSNNAESLNVLFKKDRELSILAMIEYIRSQLQQWFHDRREESQSCTSVLTPAQEDKLFKTLEVARNVCVEPLDQFRFSVRCAHNLRYIVNLNDKTCMCKQFQLESFPCTHAVAVAMYKGFPPHTLCSVYYMTDYWRAAYIETIFPVPNEVEWEVPDHILPLNNLLPPEVGPRTPGRRRTSRTPSTEKKSQSRKCGRCSATGHTRRYCTS